uniref:Putative a-kinase anchor protein 17a n=1 Tax=Lutzomyia longipalpis TaxID=7200 RepID=A0A7G3A7W5_LUTLO
MNIQTIRNVSDCVPLYLPHSLYLKAIARINISVSLPPAVVGKTISNWDVMEKLRSMIEPETFSVLKVSKSTLEFIRLEAELEDRAKLKNVVARIDGRMIKLANFSEHVRVRASEAKDDFPTRHDWDTFFRDARNMDEMKAGERPDTIHISNLPITWFCPRHMENSDNPKPSESIFKRIFEKFGEVRCVDIPICDPYRPKMKAHLQGLKTFSFENETYFEGYVQFSEYVGFVKTMDEFRGMKLVRKDGDKNLAINIVVDFDKTKHLSETSIKRRRIVRERLIEKERAQEEEDKKKQKALEAKREREKQREEERKRIELEKQKEREERRKEKHLKKLRDREQVEFNDKIRAEEKKLLETQRKLESIRLLDALFERIKIKSNEMQQAKKEEDSKSAAKNEKKGKKLENLPENDLRKKLVSRYKNSHEEELEKRREKLKKVRDDVILQDLLVKGRSRSPSIDTISSNDSILSNNSTKSGNKKKKKKVKKAKKSSSSEDESDKMNKNMVQPPAFPAMYNPETGEYIPMGMYPYGGFFPPPIAPGLNAAYFAGMDGMKPYRGAGGGYSRFPRGRGRNSYRGGRGYGYGGGGYRGYDYGDDYKYRRNEHDDRRSRSYSRSRSRSKSRRRRSRSRSRTRERSRDKSRERSRSRSRSKSRTRGKNRRLASTRRSRDRSSSSSPSRWSSRSRSRDRRRSRKTWSRDRSRSRSHGKSKSRSKSRDRSRSRSRSRRKNSAPQIKLQPEKLVRTAKEIQRNVAEKLQERLREEEEMKKNILEVEQMEKERELRAKAEASMEQARAAKKKSRSNSSESFIDSSNVVSTSPKQLSLSPEEARKSPL